MPVFRITDDLIFPPVHFAEHDGLLGVGGDLTPERLMLAYRSGIFPWYSEEDPILWYAPNPRFVLFPEKLHISRSTHKWLRKLPYRISFNENFEGVIAGCKTSPRPGQDGTWITNEMEAAYCRLHDLGYAHSCEVWNPEGELVGGIYGVLAGKCFFGESMFSRAPNASKLGLIHLVRMLVEKYDLQLFDCQVETPHLLAWGAEHIPREEYMDLLRRYS